MLRGAPRATFDLDILMEASEDNARRLLAALRAAGLATAEMVDPAAILANEITVFSDRVRIDVQTSTPGLTFRDAWDRRQTLDHPGQHFLIVSREDLIASKKAAGHSRDIEDVRILESTGTDPGSPA